VAFTRKFMYLTHLSLTNFRNFTRLDLAIPPGAIVLVGENAQGKTSLLEAIFFLSSMVSFHADSDRQLINFISAREPLAVARIVAEFMKEQKEHRFEVRIIQERNGNNGTTQLRKEIFFDGGRQKFGEVIGQLNAVLFLPQMLDIIEGSPDKRRKFINMALSQVVPHYADTLVNYTRALSQRNALLKLINERGGDPTQLEYWNEQLSISGAVLIQARANAIQEFDRLAAPIHRELSRGVELIRIDYLPSFDPFAKSNTQFALPVDVPFDHSGLTLDQIQEGYLAALSELRQEEIARGITTIGPHRDDLRFLSNGIDLGIYGSRGQVRTALLATKLAEVAWIKEKNGNWPVLLLDEVMAELDTHRRVDLLSRLTESEQVLLTTTEMDLFSKLFIENATIWRVEAGRINTEEVTS
jgi:DNA replication and repair protein RecF